MEVACACGRAVREIVCFERDKASLAFVEGGDGVGRVRECGGGWVAARGEGSVEGGAAGRDGAGAGVEGEGQWLCGNVCG